MTLRTKPQVIQVLLHFQLCNQNTFHRMQQYDPLKKSGFRNEGGLLELLFYYVERRMQHVRVGNMIC